MAIDIASLDIDQKLLIEKFIKVWNPTGTAKTALSWENPSAEKYKKGYAPNCKNKFSKSCQIKKGVSNPCSECPEKDIETLTSGLFSLYLTGNQKKNNERLGIYPLIEMDKCAWIAIDIDAHKDGQNPEGILDKITTTFSQLSIPFSVFRSQSGKGYHLYVFFDGLISAAKARALVLGMAINSGIELSKDKNNAFDGVYPKQDSISTDDYGNLIAIPFNFDAFDDRKGSYYIDLTDKDYLPESTIESLEIFFDNFETISGKEVDNLLAMANINVSDYANIARNNDQKEDGKQDVKKNTLAKIVEDCDFLKHCMDDAATLSEPEWWLMCQVLAREIKGASLIHKMSKNYPGYTKKETDRKILEVLDNQPGPVTCEKINEVYKCPNPKKCGVKCPVHLASSSQSYKKSYNEIKKEEWVKDVLLGVSVKGDELKGTAAKLSSYLLSQTERAKEDVLTDLTRWNLNNKHKLSDTELNDIIHTASENRGRIEFSEAVSTDENLYEIISIERNIYPNDDPPVYLLYLKGYSKPVKLSFEDFCSPTVFQKSFGAAVNFLCPIPRGKGSIEKWYSLVNPLLSEAVTVLITEDETEISEMRAAINEQLKKFRDIYQPDNDLATFFKSGIPVIIDNDIYVSIEMLRNMVAFNIDLRSMTKKIFIDRVIKPIGFSPVKNPVIIGSSRVRAWKMPLSEFEKDLL